MITNTIYVDKMEDPIGYCLEEEGIRLFFVCTNLNNEVYNPYSRYYLQDSLRLSRIKNLSPYKYSRISPNGYKQFSKFIMEKDKKLLNLIQREVK